ncbi:MAG: hypothetical protein ACOH12_14940 [Parvibaculaceae bacterium]
MNKLSMSLASGAMVLTAMATPAMALTTDQTMFGPGAALNVTDPDARFDAMSGEQDNNDSNIMQMGGSAADTRVARVKLDANQDKDVGFSGFYIPDN